jgi:hypothetical protein
MTAQGSGRIAQLAPGPAVLNRRFTILLNAQSGIGRRAFTAGLRTARPCLGQAARITAAAAMNMIAPEARPTIPPRTAAPNPRLSGLPVARLRCPNAIQE